jgi:hypothetical protein
MAEITLIVGATGLVVAGFAAWCTIGRRKVESSLERLPVRARRTPVLRDSDLGERQ